MTKNPTTIFLISLLMILSFLSCIREKGNICDSHICFVYDYNLQYTDLFSQEISQLTVFTFDKEGQLYNIYTDETTGTFPEGYKMNMELEENEYTFIVWSGLYADSYNHSVSNRKCTINECTIWPKDDGGNHIIKHKLPPLWHGKLEKKWDKYTPATIRLTKDHNTIRMIMKNLDDNSDEPDIDEFDIILSSSNGRYNHSNEPQDDIYQYYPYYTSRNPQSGIIAELNTLRLMADQKNTLEIIHRETGQNMLEGKLNLNTYLDALRLLQYGELNLQEYLDRANQYNIIFLYKGYDKKQKKFGSFDIEINGWLIRDNDIEW